MLTSWLYTPGDCTSIRRCLMLVMLAKPVPCRGIHLDAGRYPPLHPSDGHMWHQRAGILGPKVLLHSVA